MPKSETWNARKSQSMKYPHWLAGTCASAIAGLAAAGLPRTAHAWGDLVLIESPPEIATRSIGASLWALPRYPGAGRERATLWPALDYYAPSGVFVSTETGVGWNVSRRKDLQAGLRLWPQPGRKSSAGPAGVSPLNARIQQEAFLNYQALSALLLQSGLLHGSGHHGDGMQFEFGATSGVPIGKDLLGVGVAATFANHAHRQSYYGISQADAATSGLPATGIPAGWQDLSVTFSVEHRFDSRWHTDGQIVVARLVGAAAATPIVASRTQAAATLTLWYDW